MSIVSLKDHPLFIAGRRAFLSRSGLLLSGTAVALLAGNQALAATMKKTGADAQADDVKILNGAVASQSQEIICGGRYLSGDAVSYTHLTLPTNREV